MKQKSDSIINDCYSYAATIIYLTRNKTLDKRDIVHSAFLLLNDQGLHFTIANMKKIIYAEVREAVYEKCIPLSSTFETGGMFPNSVECKCCNRCKNSLPIAYFNKAKVYNSGFIVYQPICKDCQYERNKENTNKRASDPIKHAQYLAKEKKRYANKAQLIKNNPRLFSYFKDKRIAKKQGLLKVA